MAWFCYIVECSDGSLYTGITLDLKRREDEHNTDDKKGAKYTRYKRPVKIVYSEKFQTQSQARIREAAIKRWPKENKVKLIMKNKMGR